MIKANLSGKDKKFRDFSLTAPLMQVVLYVGIPLALYQSLTQAFKVFDTMMASHISAVAVSSVAYISQIQIMLSALGGGLAVGSSIKISEAYGAGDYVTVRQRVSTLFALCAGLGSIILLFLLPFARQFLFVMGTPKEFIKAGTTYFRLELIATVITFFNSVYICIERARGNTRRILYLNIFVIASKLSLTAFFIYGLHSGITSIAVSTIISQGFLLVAALYNMNQKDNAFGFSLFAISLKKDVILPMLNISFPIVVEKVAFALGKLIVNAMCVSYGALTVGALGITNNISGISTMPQNGFQDGSSAVISQNKGASRLDRAVKAFWCTMICCVVVGSFFMVLSIVFIDHLTKLFAGNNETFRLMIEGIYRYEMFGIVPLGVNAAVLSLLYGLGKTRITLIMNFCRLFVFRVPVMWAFQRFTDFGSQTAGIVMAVSNVSSGIFAFAIGLVLIATMKKKKNI